MVLPHMTFETFKPDGGGIKGPLRENLRGALQAARSFADNLDEWLVFIGGHGSGKTHLASAIAAHCRDRGNDVLFIIVPPLLDYLRSTFSQEGNPSYEVFEQVKNVRVLVLDDFSESSGTPWTREKLDLLLNHRYLKRLPTVITSSLSPDDMEPRIWSRMSDPRLSNVYEIMAPDYRTGREYPTRSSNEAGAEGPRARPRGRGRSA
jgi:DNA replication protein DnaC